MKPLFAFALITACSMSVQAAEPVSPAEPTPLFNGKDLSGWVRFAPGGKVDKMWTVSDGVIHCTGKPNGYIRTEKAYKDYKLTLEWRWPGEPTNSGVLLHVAGPDKVWPTCIEAQLMHEKAGDFWILQGATVKVKGETVGPGKWVNSPMLGPHVEKPPGQWNRYEITCKGDTVKLVVNGIMQNKCTDASTSSGFICLQSEGSPIEFRNIEIQPLR